MGLLRRRMRLFEMIDLADMPGRMRELEPDAFAMTAGRKAPALDHRHLVRHVRMRGIVGDRVDAGLRHDLARLEFLRHHAPPKQSKPIHEEANALNRTAFRPVLNAVSRHGW